MDSLTQIALGAAVGTAVLGRRAGPRAALWGALCGTLPDLDVLIPYGDPVRDFTYHRGVSHSLFWLTVAAPLVAWLIARCQRTFSRDRELRYRDWLLLAWAALVTHPLLDAFTVYGTQLLLPFSDYPVGLGSIFIIDPLYTLPLLVGAIAACWLHSRAPARAARWNGAGLVASTAYLAWSLVAQWHVGNVVERTAVAANLDSGRTLVTPTPFNTLVWRVVVMDDDAYYEGFRSLLDDGTTVTLQRHAHDPALLARVRNDWAIRRLAWFSKGFYAVREIGDEGRPQVVMTDLRMGQTPWFVFSFVVAEHTADGVTLVPPRQLVPRRPPLRELSWIGRRLRDERATYSSQTRET
jgi:Predicted membrane-bound metal-dependent hydrolases